MKVKIKKLLFELTRNSRITTKELSKCLKSSQQSCSYLVNMLKKKKFIQEYTVIIDAVKLGFTNVLVGFNYLNLDSQVKKDVIDYLKSNESIISIEESKRGIDIIVEYCSANLSSFNKTHSEVIDKLNKMIKTKFIWPVIVKHRFCRNYLTSKKDEKECILCGDREIVILTEKEQAVLNELVKKPDAPLINISKNTKISIKSVAAIKKRLEREAIINDYTCILDNEKLGINRYYLFLRLSKPSKEEMDKLVIFAKHHKNIIELIKIIGEYHLVLIIEELSKTDIIKKIRENFPVEDYFVAESENTHKRIYLPTGEIY